MASFVWGDGGEMLTPQEVARRRAMAEEQMRTGADYSPVGHWTQGMARLANGLVGGWQSKRAGQAEAEGLASASETMSPIIAALTGGGGMSPASPGGMSGGAYEAPVAGAGALDPEWIRSELLERGLPEPVAEGFVMNFQDESGLNPGINEIAPLVEGSRGGFGLSQWTGPRRVALEQFAASQGRPVDDPELQLDFLMTELQGPESAAAQSIMSANDPGQAAAAIVTNFLRPAEEHRNSRVARYTGGAGYAPQGGGQAPAGGQSDIISSLLAAQANPWAQQQYGPVISALLGAELGRRGQQQDPLYQLQLQQAQVDLDRSRQPERQKPIEVGGVLLDPVTMQPIFDSRTPKAADDPIAALRARAVEAGLQPGTPEYASFMAAGGKPEGGMVIESDGQGGFRMVQGSGAAAVAGKPFTEGQSKDVVFSTRARGALEVLEPLAGALTSRTERAAEWDPTGLARGMQSDDFQVAKNAGDEFLQAILRKDTGAAITEQEQALYGKTYLPQPGDSPELLEAKSQARKRAIAAIEASMSPAQMLAQERGLMSSRSVPPAPPDTAPVTPVGPMPAPAAPAVDQGQPVPIQSDAEYEALPSGASFIAPDGTVRRKP